MDELLKEFLVETGDQIESVSSQMVQFERNPTDAQLLANIFRLVHTIKGTCGFLGLPRLARIAHAAEATISFLRDGGSLQTGQVNLILSAIDRIRILLSEIEQTGFEVEGNDHDLIEPLQQVLVDRPLDENQLNQKSILKNNELEHYPGSLDPFNALEPPQAGASAESPSEPDELSLADKAVPQTEALVATVHTAQGQAENMREKRKDSVRVSVDSLERMMTLVSELVLTRNQLLELARHREDEAIQAPLQRLSSLTSDLQDGVMRARMQPVGRLFSGLPRLVRELSLELKKPIDLMTSGEDTEVDRQIIELIRDPLTHLIRNCADHGIESLQERREAQKPDRGVIRVGAVHEGGQIVIEVVDDGRGIDLTKIREKALQLGLTTPGELARMSVEELCRFIFAPGFSTASRVTAVSGRGVGMDVVRENLESIGGAVAITTIPGKGTRFLLKIPLTLSIAPALILEIGSYRFALPQHAVVEAVGLAGSTGHRIETTQGATMLRLREQTLPVANLNELLGLDTPALADDQGLVVVMQLREFTFGLRVESVADVQEIVVKPLGHLLSAISFFSGNTILGDGAVVLILDPAGIAASLGLQDREEFRRVQRAPMIKSHELTRLILFTAGPGPLKALPLSSINRVEEIESDRIEAGGSHFIAPYMGRLIPLLPATPTVMDLQVPRRPLLIVAIGGEPMGLIVSSIEDIVEAELSLQIGGGPDGIIGMVQIGDHPVEVLDATYYMQLARPGAFARAHRERPKILLIDDKPFFRDMLGPALSASGYDAVMAASAQEALALVNGTRFDAIVTDTDMPQMDGYAFAKALRNQMDILAPPILAMAACATPAVHAAAKACGMHGAVGKFDRQALLIALGEVVDPILLAGQSLELRTIGEIAA